MSVTINKYFTFLDESNVRHRLHADHPMVAVNEVRIECAGPKCATFRGAESPTVYEWTEDASLKDPSESVPDGFWRVINVEFERSQTPKPFCSAKCLVDYLHYVYVVPLSPREQVARDQRNALVDANKSVQQMDSNEDGA